MAFWGVSLKPGATKGVDSPQGDIMHLSQACLHEPRDGKNYVCAKVNGTSYALACLEKGKKEHDNFDLFFSSGDCVFVNKGQSEVHLTGYFEPDGMDEESEEEQPVPVRAQSPKAVAAGSPKAVVAGSPKKGAPVPQEDSDDDDEEGEESEEESAPPAKAASPKVGSPKAAPVIDDDDSDEGGEESEMMGDFEDEESEEEASPPPAKKAKADPEDAWVSAMHAFLKKHGKTPLGTMGTKVPRPADVPKTKLRVVFEKHKGKFTINGENVEAK